MHEIHWSLPSVKNSFYILFSVVFLVSCGDDSPSEQKLVSEIVETSEIGCGKDLSTLELSINPDFRHIKLDLYADSVGSIYHRVVDLTSGDMKTGIYRYTNYARVHNDMDSYDITKLKDLIDTASFQKSKKTDPKGRTTYFEDVNYTYHLYSMAEGRVLGARKK